jgi:hypothetical protein
MTVRKEKEEIKTMIALEELRNLKMDKTVERSIDQL